MQEREREGKVTKHKLKIYKSDTIIMKEKREVNEKTVKGMKNCSTRKMRKPENIRKFMRLDKKELRYYFKFVSGCGYDDVPYQVRVEETAITTEKNYFAFHLFYSEHKTFNSRDYFSVFSQSKRTDASRRWDDY